MGKEHLQSQKEKFNFLLPDNMKILGFDCIKDKDGYYTYVNDGTHHYNKDYNTKFPEPKGKVAVYVNINYMGDEFTNYPNIGIGQDADTRKVYNGVCPNEQFLILLLYNIR